ncbi:MAG: redoxin domain-containing protein [Anaerolinea sp.]|nr:redoxin domain-containing protein [Anaerolinea sp.]MCC6973898.1 redoxin domain-containing protein [Anaerolineae bacterium]CAG0987631.1 hypothetical protein ANRL4_02267 [Anaerolineae bacterium]
MTNLESFKPGIPAPDFSLIATSGDRVQLSDWKGHKHVLLFFMRAFNCMQCREFARRLAVEAPKLAERDTQVVILGPGSRQEADRLAKAVDKDNRLTILSDGTGEVYDRFSLNKTFFSLIQKSGVFLINRAGIIHYAAATSIPNRWLNAEVIEGLYQELENADPSESPASASTTQG